MTKNEWMAKVNENSAVLRGFIGAWHPSSRIPRQPRVQTVEVAGENIVINNPYPITAPGAERACQEARAQILKSEPEDPCARFDKAVAAQDVHEIYSLLDGAWFGVPESTQCWGIEGFSLAVDLMDDIPDEEEPK